jgi:hypothetical protein
MSRQIIRLTPGTLADNRAEARDAQRSETGVLALRQRRWPAGCQPLPLALGLF